MGKSDRHNILVLDVGTTGVKAFVFDRNLNPVVRVYEKLRKDFPKRGWVEQNPQELLAVSRKTLRAAVVKSGCNKDSFSGLGITNQRETTILWDKKTGQPVYPAIVWEDTRTKRFCSHLKKRAEALIRRKTGLPIDAYFSASKIRWILRKVPEAERLSEEKQLAFGTVDSWILWNFLENHPHRTDYTNASRTLLFNIKTLEWDKELLGLFHVPPYIIPQVRPSQSFFGILRKEIVGFPIPVLAVCGDQQASLYAAGTEKGTTKVTWGTGMFIMQILGRSFSTQELFFTTLVPDTHDPLYALEAKMDACGKQVETVLKNREELQRLLTKLAHRADKFFKYLPVQPKRLVIDGGVSREDRLPQIQSKVSGIPVQKQKIFDGTALGIAMLVQEQSRA